MQDFFSSSFVYVFSVQNIFAGIFDFRNTPPPPPSKVKWSDPNLLYLIISLAFIRIYRLSLWSEESGRLLPCFVDRNENCIWEAYAWGGILDRLSPHIVAVPQRRFKAFSVNFNTSENIAEIGMVLFLPRRHAETAYLRQQDIGGVCMATYYE